MGRKYRFFFFFALLLKYLIIYFICNCNLLICISLHLVLCAMCFHGVRFLSSFTTYTLFTLMNLIENASCLIASIKQKFTKQLNEAKHHRSDTFRFIWYGKERVFHAQYQENEFQFFHCTKRISSSITIRCSFSPFSNGEAVAFLKRFSVVFRMYTVLHYKRVDNDDTTHCVEQRYRLIHVVYVLCG